MGLAISTALVSLLSLEGTATKSDVSRILASCGVLHTGHATFIASMDEESPQTQKALTLAVFLEPQIWADPHYVREETLRAQGQLLKPSLSSITWP